MIQQQRILFMISAGLTSLIASACITQTRANLDIRKSGFISTNCYQAVIEVEADEGTQGLIERRESAYLKAKKINVRDKIAENMANYCIDAKLKRFQVGPQRKNLDTTRIKSDLVPALKKFITWEKLVFLYYTENNAVVLGYQIHKRNLNDSITMLIDGMELGTAQ